MNDWQQKSNTAYWYKAMHTVSSLCTCLGLFKYACKIIHSNYSYIQISYRTLQKLQVSITLFKTSHVLDILNRPKHVICLYSQSIGMTTFSPQPNPLKKLFYLLLQLLSLISKKNISIVITRIPWSVISLFTCPPVFPFSNVFLRCVWSSIALCNMSTQLFLSSSFLYTHIEDGLILLMLKYMDKHKHTAYCWQLTSQIIAYIS